MRFGVLGPLAVWSDAGDLVAVPGPKVRALLADLLVHEGTTVSVDRLAEDVWGDEPPADPAAAVQVRVWQLRRALAGAEPGGRDLVAFRPPGYLLRTDLAAVDAGRFAELTARARAAGDLRARAALLAEALGLWRGPALADFGDAEFARTTIARLEEQRLTVLEEHAETRLELGEHGSLAAQLADLVARHPLRERLRAAHMRALYRAGRQSEALAGYGELRERLAEDLGIDPGPDVAALHHAILVQDPALAGPPAPAAPRARGNLPAPLSDLVGRAEAVTRVRSALRAGRLVTLTGTGGVGKTRLALEAAAEPAGDFPDGVWLVELAALDRGTNALAETVLTALGIREDAGSGAVGVDRLRDTLRSRRLLLVLDNCEHVVEQAAGLAETLLRAAPGLRILATSREPLAVPGEVVWRVPPLRLPDGTDLDAVERSDAVRLFVARAAAANREFALDARNAQTIGRLCRRLDGIPLALELAATRVPALGVQGLLSRLDDRFRLLAAGRRTAAPRQRTLAAVIDWSWELLAGPEQAVLRRLAVHADGCTLEAAEQVCAAGPPGGPAGAGVLDSLARLVDRSLVVMTEDSPDARYGLLESIAEYCVRRLIDAAELDGARRAHLRYYLALAERAEPELYGHEQRDWLRRLDAEAANLRAALDTARRTDAASALRLVNALAWYWFLRGRPAEARRSLDAALDAAPAAGGDAPAAMRARAAAWRAGFALLQGEAADWAAALRMYEGVDDPGGLARSKWFLGLAMADLAAAPPLLHEALTTFREIGDEWGVAAALSALATDAFTRRDTPALESYAEESTRLFRGLGDRWGRIQATECHGALAEMAADAERATRLFTDALGMAKELGLWPKVVTQLCWLGWTALGTGDNDAAMDLAEQAMAVAGGQGHRGGNTFARMVLAFATRRAGKLDLAETRLNQLLDGVPRDPAAQVPPHLSDTLIELGYLHEGRGDPETARDLHLEALAAARKVNDPGTMALAVEGLAAALAAAGSHTRAAVLLGLATAAREAARTRRSLVEHDDVTRTRTRATRALGEPAFTRAYDRGTELKLDEAPTVLAPAPNN